MIKLVATDIDGTILVPETKEFSLGVRKCIKRLSQNGIKVVLVTGRMNAAAVKIAKDLELDTPVVSYQGGFITQDNNVLYERYLSKEQSESIIEWASKENIHLNLYNNDILYSEKDCYEIHRYCGNLHTEYQVKKFADIDKNQVNKILAIDYYDTKRVDRLEKELQNIFPELYIVKSTPYFIEFSSKDASKYCAVKFLQKYWGISESETLAIGDQNNDIALLDSAGVKVAMGNATEDLKMIANYTTESVFNDGFVKAMEKYCNI